MMCEGVSPASWMMNSPRSVSTTSTPSASSTSLRWISSLAIDLPLATIRACCAADEVADHGGGLGGVGGPVDVTAVGLEPRRPLVEQLGQLGHHAGPERPGRVTKAVGVLEAGERVQPAARHQVRGVAHRRPEAVVAQVPLGAAEERDRRRADGRGHGRARVARRAEDLGQVAEAQRQGPAPGPTLEVHEAGQVPADDGLDAGRGPLVEPVVGHGHRHGRELHAERAAEAAAALGPLALDHLDALLGQQPPRLRLDPELPQAVAAVVHGDGRRRRATGAAAWRRPGVEVGGQLDHPPGDGAGLRLVGRAGEDLRPVPLHHRGAGAGRDDDRPARAAQRPERRPGHATGRGGEPGVPGRLPAARTAVGRPRGDTVRRRHERLARPGQLGTQLLDEAGREDDGLAGRSWTCGRR